MICKACLKIFKDYMFIWNAWSMDTPKPLKDLHKGSQSSPTLSIKTACRLFRMWTSLNIHWAVPGVHSPLSQTSSERELLVTCQGVSELFLTCVRMEEGVWSSKFFSFRPVTAPPAFRSSHPHSVRHLGHPLLEFSESCNTNGLV